MEETQDVKVGEETQEKEEEVLNGMKQQVKHRKVCCLSSASAICSRPQRVQVDSLR